MESNKKEKSKLDIKRELISEELSKLLGAFVIFCIISGLCGYIGYIYSKDNNISISHGIIFGILFPLGVGLLELVDWNNFIVFILYTIAYLAIVSYIPTFVGGIILLLIIGIFILDFIYIERKDRSEEIEEYYKYQKEKNTTVVQNNAEDIINKYNVLKNYNNRDSFKEEFECEMCFKKISEEEYELYDGMCEECFMDVHIDENGEFHDDEFF